MGWYKQAVFLSVAGAFPPPPRDVFHGLRLVFYHHMPEPLQSGGRNVFVRNKYLFYRV